MVDSTSILHFTRDRTLIPGPPGHTISGPDWLDVTTRLSAVEAIAETTNPTPNQPGVILTTGSHGLGIGEQTSIVMGVNQILMAPIFIRDGFTANQMALFVNTPQAGGVLGLAVYGPSWSLIRDFGTVSASSGGPKFSTTTGVSISAGTHWLAVRSNNVAGIAIVGIFPAFPMFYSDTSLQSYGAYAAGPETSFPATFSVGGLVQDMPWIGLRTT